jgi:PAS domain S-box-containing protein
MTVGILFARPHAGLMSPILSARLGGNIARRLWPILVAVPILLNWLVLIGIDAGHYSAEFGYALSALASIVILTIIVWFGAHHLNAMQESLQRHSRRSARWAAIVSSSEDAIIGADLEGKVTSWNDAAERLYGFSAAEILGQPILRMVPADRLEEESEIFAAIREGRHVSHLETVRLRKNGERVELSINASPIKDESGALIGVSKIARDITSRKRNEALLRETVEASPTGLIMSNSSGHIVLVNVEAEKLFGYERRELLGASVESLIPERYRNRHVADRNHFLAAPKRRRMGGGRDLYGIKKDGSEFPVEIGLSPVQTSNDVMVLSSIVDITERKRDEENLHARTEELARSNRDLEQFAYVASHDLQEPLRAVSGCVQLLQKRYEGQLDARADEFISHTVSGVERMQKLIEDLLTFSRVGRLEDAVRATDCNDVIASTRANLAAAIRESGAELIHGELPVIDAIPSEMTMLFQNLVGNAIKFRRKDVATKVAVTAQREDGEWRFSVKDNGIGIEEQYFVRVFDIFQRLHTRVEYPGTGIGLPLCKRIVEKHGGRIWLESEPGIGTEIFFTLPARRREPAVDARSEAPTR